MSNKKRNAAEVECKKESNKNCNFDSNTAENKYYASKKGFKFHH